MQEELENKILLHNLRLNFDFSNIYEYEYGCNLYFGKRNFLVKQLMHSYDGIIPRNGDVLFAISNTSKYDIHVSISNGYKEFYETRIPVGEIVQLPVPIMLISTPKDEFTYNVRYDSSQYAVQQAVDRILFDISYEFVYGIFKEKEHRMTLANSFLYKCCPNTDTLHIFGLYFTWLYTFITLHPNSIGEEFERNYLACKYTDDEVLKQFEEAVKHNSRWIKFE